MKKLSLFLATLIFSSTAFAVPIEGLISWSGYYDRVNNVLSFSNVTVQKATHDFAAEGIVQNAAMTVADVDLDTFSPVSLWTLNGFTYMLEDINIIMDGMFTVISGSGTMTHVNGQTYDPTHFAFGYSSQFGNSFSAAAVPEPGSLALLGAGLAGLLLTRRRAGVRV